MYYEQYITIIYYEQQHVICYDNQKLAYKAINPYKNLKNKLHTPQKRNTKNESSRIIYEIPVITGNKDI